MAVQGPIPVEFGQVFPRGVRGGWVRAGAGFRGVEGRAVRAVEGQGERPAAVGDRRDRRRHLGAGQDGSGEGRGGGSAGAAARAPGDAVRPGGVRRADGHPASATKPLRQVWGRSCGTPGRSATPPAERAHNGHADATGHPEYHSENNDHASDLGGNHGAGEGNRTLMTSLEGWRSAIELRPRARREPLDGSPGRHRQRTGCGTPAPNPRGQHSDHAAAHRSPESGILLVSGRNVGDQLAGR